MTEQEMQKYLFEARGIANKTNKYIGVVKGPTGKITFEEIETPIKSSFTFADSQKFKGCCLLGYAFPLVPGKNKINPLQWRLEQIKAQRDKGW